MSNKVFLHANENGDFITVEKSSNIIEISSSNFDYIKSHWDYDDILTLVSLHKNTYIQPNEKGDKIIIDSSDIYNSKSMIEIISSNFDYIKSHWDYDDFLTLCSSIELK